ncbi:MAG: hypothetical protein MHM6MM_003611 [Cercozoa sp. M6MM]
MLRRLHQTVRAARRACVARPRGRRSMVVPPVVPRTSADPRVRLFPRRDFPGYWAALGVIGACVGIAVSMRDIILPSFSEEVNVARNIVMHHPALRQLLQLPVKPEEGAEEIPRPWVSRRTYARRVQVLRLTDDEVKRDAARPKAASDYRNERHRNKEVSLTELASHFSEQRIRQREGRAPRRHPAKKEQEPVQEEDIKEQYFLCEQEEISWRLPEHIGNGGWTVTVLGDWHRVRPLTKEEAMERHRSLCQADDTSAARARVARMCERRLLAQQGFTLDENVSVVEAGDELPAALPREVTVAEKGPAAWLRPHVARDGVPFDIVNHPQPHFVNTLTEHVNTIILENQERRVHVRLPLAFAHAQGRSALRCDALSLPLVPPDQPMTRKRLERLAKMHSTSLEYETQRLGSCATAPYAEDLIPSAAVGLASLVYLSALSMIFSLHMPPKPGPYLTSLLKQIERHPEIQRHVPAGDYMLHQWSTDVFGGLSGAKPGMMAMFTGGFKRAAAIEEQLRDGFTLDIQLAEARHNVRMRR